MRRMFAQEVRVYLRHNNCMLTIKLIFLHTLSIPDLHPYFYFMMNLQDEIITGMVEVGSSMQVNVEELDARHSRKHLPCYEIPLHEWVCMPSDDQNCNVGKTWLQTLIRVQGLLTPFSSFLFTCFILTLITSKANTSS